MSFVPAAFGVFARFHAPYSVDDNARTPEQQDS
jgi:hypothetical protein